MLAEREGDYPWSGNDEIVAVVEGNKIIVTHLNATYNCCPDEIGMRLLMEGDKMKLIEEEILSTPCDCMCCYNVDTEIAGLIAGKYFVEVCWADYETQETLCNSITVVVPN